jgi:hypothetical protein
VIDRTSEMFDGAIGFVNQYKHKHGAPPTLDQVAEELHQTKQILCMTLARVRKRSEESAVIFWKAIELPMPEAKEPKERKKREPRAEEPAEEAVDEAQSEHHVLGQVVGWLAGMGDDGKVRRVLRAVNAFFSEE